MRILLFFDLPTITSTDRRNYSRFRKYLLKDGFIMLQESVYCKLAINNTVVDSVLLGVRKQKPPEGNIMALCVTEKQFQKMEFILGSHESETIDSDERLIIL